MPLTKLRPTPDGGMRITITVPPMPEVPEGYRWVGWDLHSEASQDLAEGIKAWLWDLSEGADGVYGLRALAVNVDDPEDWIAASFDHVRGDWTGGDWLFSDGPACGETPATPPGLINRIKPSLN